MLTHDDVHEGPADAAPSVDVPAQTPGALWLGPAFARSPVAMGVVDAFGRLLAVNQSLGDYLGRSPEALVGTTLHAHASADDVGRLRTGTSERRLRHARGHDLWAVVSAVPMPEAGDGAILICLDDATSRRNTERMLLHAALHDSLTNLPNRRLLRDRLDTALSRARRSTERVAVLFVDLDRFKAVNDTFGHDVGDEVLVSVAKGILGALRSKDTVARLGGDEFVVIAEELGDDDDLSRLVARLVDGISRPVQVHGREVSVSASIGVAIASPDADTGDELLRLADLAMLRAKQHPELAYVVADESVADELHGDPREGRGLTAELRHAIQADLLELHYQPVVRIDGHLMGLEALLRWQHP
ncbi:MAG: hypothetical protein QOD68_1093, partial [Actinomycetota bacterium]|nr:hypothetical protein [Actinomycetota bacterium]